ncbi:glycosyltransferase family 2 protein [Vibrio rarus]|uniref:glycosyltransferase family 2 protein n=1 Tax=Vibrio rarus TaxID=413403 RepID=UPI0021C45AE7|nr:glycosyltransferase [Vibrio rarus]
MLLSIIIPVYNVENYIEDLLNSLSCDKFDNTKVEFIFVDDGSPDNSIDICKKHISSNMKLYTKENGGLSSARNYGLIHASGDYVFFIDSDDVISSTAIALLLETISNQSVDLISFNAFRFKDAPSLVTSHINCSVKKIEDYYTKPLYAWNKVFKRSLLLNLSPLFPEGKVFEDISTIPLLINMTRSFVHINEPLYGYRIREGSITTTNSAVLGKLLEALELLKIRSNTSNYANICIVKECFGIVINLIRSDDFNNDYSNANVCIKHIISRNEFISVYRTQSFRSIITFMIVYFKLFKLPLKLLNIFFKYLIKIRA